jgi:hypothetical protein
MKRLASLVFSFALAALIGCASTTSITPAQTVFAAKSAYATALTAAVAYKRLPACTSSQPMPCSDAGVVQQLQRADNVAAVALDAAEAAVRTPAISGDARSKAIQTATLALQALQAITLNLGAQ